ncbi:MAG: peptide deformylase [Oscillospiraceae bacterium]|nr:peptide deformylase [Candidatus Equicaccousia limihippi]
MALRNIVKIGDPILRKTSRSVLNFDSKLHSLLDDMADTLHEAQGVGLAAPQVGILRRICIVEIDEENGLIELINPVIIEESGEQHETEGCLSIPGESGTTVRPMKVKVRAQNRNGETFTVEGEGLKARAFCHEIDHLNGILYKDRLEK